MDDYKTEILLNKRPSFDGLYFLSHSPIHLDKGSRILISLSILNWRVWMIQREHLGSRLGFILLSAGCAIGVGNVWKFPWMAGQYGGRWWGSLFFLFMVFAAFSTIIAVFENILACVRELIGWGRIKACVICGIAILLLSVPCALGYNLWSNFVPFASDSAVLDLEDFLVSNCCLPLGALCYVLFCVSKKRLGL